MSQLNSSISNSDYASSRPGSVGYVTIWVFVWLIALDILINIFVAYPIDPKIENPSRLRAYFEYGRSTEAQLSRMTRAGRLETAPITLAGWYDPLQVLESKSQKPIVTFYGMSHSVRLAFALGRVSDRFVARSVGAPAATSNWSYGAYLRDRGGGKSRAVVLAFMSANLAMITTMSPMTWNIDSPMPYTADRFFLDGDRIRMVHPPYASFEDYVETFNDPKKWSAARDVFAEYDSMYNPLIFRENILDHSSLFRLVRRAYSQRYIRNMRKSVLDGTGFHPESEQVRVARAIVHEFAVQARKDGMIPVIFLVNNLGYSDYLFQALSPTLRADNIRYLSSHLIVSPNDPRGYLPDSHFTDEVDNELARALVKLVENPE